MSLEIGLTEKHTNTNYAPLAALLAHYQTNHTLVPLEKVHIGMKKRDFSPIDKLEQVLISILAGCETISEVNTRLDAEVKLARVGGWSHFSDQSNLSRTLDALTLKQIDQIRGVVTAIWRANGRTCQRDWRSYLWLDFDLSGLPCSPRAEKSQKGFFREKKSLWAPISPSECDPVPRNHLVRSVSREPAYGSLPAACGQRC